MYIGDFAARPYGKFMFQLAVAYIQYPVYIGIYLFIGYFIKGMHNCAVFTGARAIIMFNVFLLLFGYYLHIFVSPYELYIHTVHIVGNLFLIRSLELIF